MESYFRFVFDFIPKLDSIVSCLATSDFSATSTVSRPFLVSSVSTLIWLLISCITGQTLWPVTSHSREERADPGPVKAVQRNVEGRCLEWDRRILSVRRKRKPRWITSTWGYIELCLWAQAFTIPNRFVSLSMQELHDCWWIGFKINQLSLTLLKAKS